MAKRSKKKSSKQTFQVALSFAGADRGFANKLARWLKKFGLNIFLDSDQLSEVIGEDSEKLREIYGKQSKHVVPIISQHYSQSDHAQVEFEAAVEGEKAANTKLIPIRLDDTPQFGLRKDKIFIDPADHSIKAIASAIAAKCGVDTTQKSKIQNNKDNAPPILSADSRLALGLIAYSRLPFTLEDLQQFFPSIDWSKSQKELEQNGHIQIQDRVVVADKKSARTVLANEGERDSLRDKWKKSLEPFQYQMDLALELALIYLDESNWEKGVQLLVDVANDSNTGYWSKVYISTFKTISKGKSWKSLSTSLKLQLLHALGKCLSHTDEYEESLAVLNRAKTTAKRVGDDTWHHQILLTMGVVHHHKGNAETAKNLYEEVISLAEESDDKLLLGRALGNLATLKKLESPHLARELLEQSIEAKRAAKDKAGEAVAVFQLGTIEANRCKPDFALVQYEKCLELKKKNEYCIEPEDALLFHNLGLAHLECGRNSKALGFFKRSVEAARSVGLVEYEEMALARLATAYFELRRFDDLIQTCEEMWELAERSGNVQNMLCAKHGIGIAQILMGQRRIGLRSLNSALQIARDKKEFDWVVRCLVDLTRPVAAETFGNMDLNKVRKAAKSEQRNGNKHVAAALYVRIANHIQIVGGDPRREFLALEHAWDLLKRVKNIPEDSIYSLKQIHAGFWNAQRFDDALSVHAKLENAVDGVMAIEYSNGRGCLLMDLDRQPEAEVIFSRLVDEVRELEAPEVLAMLLNNLGECLRQQGRHQEAEAAYEESEEIAAEVGNYESEIGTAHNRAIAYQNDGDLDRAVKLFERCRDKAERRKYWKEYVRAWEALAGVASQQGKVGLAKNRYERALKEAKKHKCDDNLGRIALNYSNWLYYEGETRSGLRLLKRYQGKFDHFADSHIYYFAMALCHEELQELPEAGKVFKETQQRALNFGDESYVAKCASHIAEIGIYIKTPANELRAEIEPLLRRIKNPVKLLTLLECLLRVEIEADDEKRAQKVYNRGKRLSEKYELPLGLVDLNLVIAEADRKNGEYDRKLQAMRIWPMRLVMPLRMT